MTNNSYDYDVIVVGAGPSGLTTATAVARSGVRVLVVERRRTLSIFPKATGIRPRSMEILRSWGLDDEIYRRVQASDGRMSISPTLAVPGQLVDLGLPDPQVLAALSPALLAVAGQDQFEQVVFDHLISRGGEVRFATEMIEMSQDEGSVHLTVRERDSGSESRLTARYLVAADGGRSRIRSALGIEFEQLASEGNHLSVLFTGDLSPVMPSAPPILSAVVAPGVEGLFVVTGVTDRWVYDMDWHPERGERLEDWTEERFTARLRAASGIADLRPEILGIFPWDFGAGIAHGMRRGRVFLVGDAAHRTTPRGATGMNTGIADAHNLGWKLAWVTKGWAGEALLDSYAAEREPVGHANASASLQTTVGRPPGDGLAHDFGVTYASSAIVGGTPLAGQRAPHAWIQPVGALSASKGQSSSGKISTIDLFDGHFTLITGPDASAWRSAAEESDTDGPLSVLSVGVELEDPTGELADRYPLGERGGILVRPDGYVAWGSAEADTDRLRDALRLATGHRVAELVG